MKVENFKAFIRTKYSNSGKTKTVSTRASVVVNDKLYEIELKSADEATINSYKRGEFTDKIISTDINCKSYRTLIEMAEAKIKEHADYNQYLVE